MALPAVSLEKRGKSSEGRGYLLIPTNRIRRYPGQPRMFIDPLALLDLQKSIAEIGQRRPVIVKVVQGDPVHDYELIDGERRWLCCKRLGIAKMKAVFEEPADDDEQFLSAVVANIPSQPHSPLEIAHAIDRLRKSKQMHGVPVTEAMNRIGATFGHDYAWAYRYHRLLELDPRVQALMDGKRTEEERLNTSIATFLIGRSPETQVKIAMRALSQGWGLRQVELFAAQLTAETGEVRVGRRKKPVDHYRNLLSFLRRLKEGTGFLLSMPNKVFEEMFLRRDPEDREKVLEEVKTCRADLAEIEQVLKRLEEEQKSPKKR